VVEKIEQAGLTSAKIRSVLTCAQGRGLREVLRPGSGPRSAGGERPSHRHSRGPVHWRARHPADHADFHIGGTASRRVEQADIRARVEGTVKFIDLNVAKNSEGAVVAMNRAVARSS